jgi:uncharacterized repeat protein (TIGR01451 family)
VRPRRLVHVLLGALIVMSTSVTACGGGLAQISVDLTSKDSQPFSPGDTPTFVVTVRNNGPGGTGGVTVHVDLPAAFHYKDTKSLGGTAVRTQPVDAAVNSASPVWGIWNLAGPGETAVITFEATAAGKPGTYNVVARASGDNTEGETQSSPFAMQLAAAPNLSMAVAVAPNSVKFGDAVTYRVTVTNDGSGIANGVSVLVSLPPIFVYNSTILPYGGNASRNKAVDPIKGTMAVFYGGFDVPPRSDSGPGLLVIAFTADVLRNAGATGSYTVGVQLTDDQADHLVLNESSPVAVH